MNRRHYRSENDNWTDGGEAILSEKNRQIISQILSKGPMLVMHWFYRAARGPEYKLFENIEDFEEYLGNEAIPGDAFQVWDLTRFIKPDGTSIEAKLPDVDGKTPRGGAY